MSERQLVVRAHSRGTVVAVVVVLCAACELASSGSPSGRALAAMIVLIGVCSVAVPRRRIEFDGTVVSVYHGPVLWTRVEARDVLEVRRGLCDWTLVFRDDERVVVGRSCSGADELVRSMLLMRDARPRLSLEAKEDGQ